jgi:hypothetical protein
MVWRNFLDPQNNRKPIDRTVWRDSKKDVRKSYVNKYQKMYPQWKFSIRKSKELKDVGVGKPFEVFIRDR